MELLTLGRLTVSSDYRITIPKEVRKAMGIKPGSKVQVFVYNGRIQVIPVRPMREMRGFLKGMDSTIKRDKDRV